MLIICYLKHLKKKGYFFKSLGMSDVNFKVKQKKKSSSGKQQTLDSIHNQKIKDFEEIQKSLKVKKKKLEQLKKKYQLLNTKKLSQLSDEELEEKLNLGDDIKDLEQEINQISHKNHEKEYLIKTSALVYQYYENIDRIAQGNNVQSSKQKNDSNILNFFQNSQVSLSKTPQIDTSQQIAGSQDYQETNFTKLNNKYLTKEKILDQYLHQVDPHHVPKNKIDNFQLEICHRCKIEREFNQTEAMLICHQCGETETVLLDSEKPSYKDPPREISYFAYKRINHFNEWLAQFQAKESTDIPDLVYNQILMELKKERIDNMASLQPLKLREILKRLKLNKYYEHVPHIINRLNGVPAPIMTRNMEEKLRTMFKEIQTPFMKHCPKDRKNFLSYSYVLHKFVELLGLDDFLPCFPLLKSREKLLQQDKIWKKICEDLRWEFIKSI